MKVHRCPISSQGGITPCCGKTPFELPIKDRITQEDSKVTCRVLSAVVEKPYVPPAAGGTPSSEKVLRDIPIGLVFAT